MTRTVATEGDCQDAVPPASDDGGSSGGDSELPPAALAVPSHLATTYLHTKKVAAYLIGRQIGEGSFATVFEAMHMHSGELVAVKVVDKQKAISDPYVCRNLRREGRILQRLRHPGVVQLLEVLETDHSYYLVAELCTGGDLLSYVTHRKRLSEEAAREFLWQILNALRYIHKLGIVHRDLKIENILLTSESKLKIIDFGLSTLLKTARSADGTVLQQLLKTQCGSPAYAAPEVLARQPYGAAVDVWSIGVNLFAMLAGGLPFSTKPYSIRALHQKMVAREMNPLPKDVSAGCRDLLLRLLEPQPERRITVHEALTHPWLRQRGSSLSSSLSSSVMELPAAPQPLQAARENLHEQLLHRCAASLGVSVEEVTHKVLHNVASSCLATYSLLVARARRYCLQHRLQFSDAPVAAAGVADDSDAELASSVGADSCNSSCCSSGSSRAASDTQERGRHRLLTDRLLTGRMPLQHAKPQTPGQSTARGQAASVLDLRVTRDRTSLYGSRQLPHIHRNGRPESSRRLSVSRRRCSDTAGTQAQAAAASRRSGADGVHAAATVRQPLERRVSVDSQRLTTGQ